MPGLSCVICEMPAAAFRLDGTDIPLCGVCVAIPVLVRAYREGLVRRQTAAEASAVVQAANLEQTP